ncbi:4'-phosphopantetheinyl transferase family protein [Myroides sp. DW712]|uniref:4'-phosphopantetheinyl transferase family protein n=1 Tax=Myroides sp. DW712 TaxID=3389800 RepID=UPI00397A0B77
MGLVKEITVESAKLYVWHITESLLELEIGLELSTASQMRLAKMKAENHQKAFLAVRQILRQLNFADCDLCYDKNGRPSLCTGEYISISHSFDYAIVAISAQNIGVDVELIRDKIIRLSGKFCNERELALAPVPLEDKKMYLTEIWSVKEALFKMCNSRSLSFAQDMEVHVEQKQAKIKQDDFQKQLHYHTFRLGNYVFVVSY